MGHAINTLTVFFNILRPIFHKPIFSQCVIVFNDWTLFYQLYLFFTMENVFLGFYYYKKIPFHLYICSFSLISLVIHNSYGIIESFRVRKVLRFFPTLTSFSHLHQFTYLDIMCELQVASHFYPITCIKNI